MKRASVAWLACMILGGFTLSVYASWDGFNITNNFPTVLDVAAFDMDSDSDIDIVGVGTSGLVAWFENLGNQTFTQHTIATNMTSARRVCAGDLDNDGDIDLVVNTTEPSIGVVRLMNDGAMQFTAVQMFSWSYFWEMELCDLDQDGDLDLISSTPGGNLRWWENTQGGQVFVVHILSYDSGRGFGLSDLDDDGDPDIVSWVDQTVVWFENISPQTFALRTIVSAGDYGFEDVAAGDLDGDGDQDILAGYDGFYWYANDGNQHFTYMGLLPGTGSPSQVHVLDLDGDGCQDIVLTNFMKVKWVENFLCLNFHMWELSQNGAPGTVHYDLCDLNQDGKMDVVACGTISSNTIICYENQLNPTVKLLVEADSQPITIPPQGGEFSFNVCIWNTTADTLLTDFWAAAGSEYGPGRNPVMLVRDLALAPDVPVERRVTQRVPGFVPPMYYEYQAMVGDFPDVVTDYGETFGLYKIAENGVNGSNVDCWYDTGARLTCTDNECIISVLPNPFNPSTVLSFELRVASHVSLKVYDTAGRLVATLVDGWREAGEYQVSFDGSGLPSGVYLYCFTAGSWSETGKMVLMK